MDIWPPQCVREELAAVLVWSAHASWWATPAPDLGGRSPGEVWRAGERCRVMTMLERYRDPAFT
jgi:hypothetical protein